MFVYTWVKGAQKGYLDESYLQKGKEAYEQFVQRFLKEERDGTLAITDSCAVAGLRGATRYIGVEVLNNALSEPIRDNDPKAVGPFMMMGVLLDK